MADEIKRSKKLAWDIENPGAKFLREASDTKNLSGRSGEIPLSMMRGAAAAFLGTPVAVYKELTAAKLSDEDKAELKREVTRGNKGKDKMTDLESIGYKQGGSVSARADGVAQRGKTRGKIC